MARLVRRRKENNIQNIFFSCVSCFFLLRAFWGLFAVCLPILFLFFSLIWFARNLIYVLESLFFKLDVFAFLWTKRERVRWRWWWKKKTTKRFGSSKAHKRWSRFETMRPTIVEWKKIVLMPDSHLRSHKFHIFIPIGLLFFFLIFEFHYYKILLRLFSSSLV